MSLGFVRGYNPHEPYNVIQVNSSTDNEKHAVSEQLNKCSSECINLVFSELIPKININTNEDLLFEIFQKNHPILNYEEWRLFIFKNLQLNNDNINQSIQESIESVCRRVFYLETIAHEQIKVHADLIATIFSVFNQTLVLGERNKIAVALSNNLIEYLNHSLWENMEFLRSNHICLIAPGLRKLPLTDTFKETLHRLYENFSTKVYTRDAQVEIIHTFNVVKYTNGLHLWDRLNIKEFSKEQLLQLLSGLTLLLPSSINYYPSFNFHQLIEEIMKFDLTIDEFIKVYAACCICDYTDKSLNKKAKKYLSQPGITQREHVVLTNALQRLTKKNYRPDNP